MLASRPPQRAFVDEYLRNGRNGAAAYRAAYRGSPSPQRCAEQACRLLRHRKIAPIFAAAEARAVERTQVVVNRYAIDRARIMAELAAIGFSSLGDYLRPNADGDPVPSFADLTAQQMAAVAEVTIDKRSVFPLARDYVWNPDTPCLTRSTGKPHSGGMAGKHDFKPPKDAG